MVSDFCASAIADCFPLFKYTKFSLVAKKCFCLSVRVFWPGPSSAISEPSVLVCFSRCDKFPPTVRLPTAGICALMVVEGTRPDSLGAGRAGVLLGPRAAVPLLGAPEGRSCSWVAVPLARSPREAVLLLGGGPPQSPRGRSRWSRSRRTAGVASLGARAFPAHSSGLTPARPSPRCPPACVVATRLSVPCCHCRAASSDSPPPAPSGKNPVITLDPT